MRTILKTLPLLYRDVRLSENCAEQISINIGSMGIRNPQSKLVLDHKLVLSARIRSLKAELTETLNQLGPRDGAEAGHQATSWVANETPSIEGIECPLFSPRTIH